MCFSDATQDENGLTAKWKKKETKKTIERNLFDRHFKENNE